MNLYDKINKARTSLKNKDIKKSGKNKHLGFSYMELADFLPHIIDINEELKLTSLFRSNADGYTLKIVNNEKPEEIEEFTSIGAKATLQGKPSPVQELGAEHTYMRRYLYMEAYEISENDVLDGSVGEDKQTQAVTTDQLQKAIEEKHVPIEQVLERYTKESGNKASELKFIKAEYKQKYYNELKSM